MIFRIVYNGIDLMGSDLDSCVLNPSLEQELNTAGSLTFTMPPTHPMWGAMKVFVGDIEVYENGELIFFGRIVNIDQNWNNERIIECEGALAFFNDTYIDGHVRWDEEGTTVGSFFTDIVNRHNALVPDNRKIFVGNIDQSFMNYLVTREVEWEKTLDVISQMCIDTNGGWLMLRKDLEEDKIYIDWVKDITSGIDQPVQFGLNLLDVTKSYHGEDICTAVIPRGEQNDEGVYLDISEMPTVSDVGHVDHTYGSNILYHHEGVENYGAVLQVHDFSSCATKEDLYEEARVWLIKKNTDVATIEVEAAELGYFGDGYPIFKVGKLVEVIDGIHFPDETTVTYPMYKISMNLDSGKKQITIGTPPKKELTQIYASDVDSTGNGGVKSGTSSGGGSGGSGSGDGVTDVIVNGSSVVNNHVASFSAVSTNQMNTAINNATSGLASTSYVDNAVAPKANTSDVNTALALKANTSDVTSALALKADKTEIIDVVANPSGTGSTDLSKLKVGNDIYNIPSGGGGTEVEANPSEPATDDLNTIKIGNTVYDIPGGGSGGSTNYGKFDCDLLFVNDPLPSPQPSGGGWTQNYVTTESIDNYDAVCLIASTDYSQTGVLGGCTKTIVLKDNYYDSSTVLSGSYTDGRLAYVTFTDSTHISVSAWASAGYAPILYKVYGLKFENKLINRSDIYSEEERLVGRWTDGKPLYQKTTILTGSYTGSVDNVSIGIENKNVETICKISCVGITSGGSIFPIPFINASSSSDNSGFAILSSYLINLRFGTITIAKLQFTIQYTKTTDTPGTGPTPGNLIYLPALYSEEEREVGVWTDGKPIYQKTFKYSNLPTVNNWTVFDSVNSNYDELVNVIQKVQYPVSLDQVMATPDLETEPRFCIKTDNKLYYYTTLSFQNISVTIQYTKTTDQPGSGRYLPDGQLAHHYSTSEKVVGTWIDGSTVYERTWDFGSNVSVSSGNYYTGFNINSSSMDKVLSGKIMNNDGTLYDNASYDPTRDNHTLLGIKPDNNCNIRYLTLQYTKSS